MSRSYDGFVGSADTPFVITVFPPDFKSGEVAEVRYCYEPSDVLATVREYGVEPTADEIVALLSCWAGEGVVIGGYEFSVEREW